MKRIATFLALAVLVMVGVIVVRETAGLVVLARALDPRLGTAVLWLLIATYAITLGVPVVLFLRLRAPIVPPRPDAGEAALQRHRVRLARRLSRHPLVNARVDADARAIEQALAPLDERAEREMRSAAALVFVSTAVAQSGRLDALFVLVAQTRLVWRLAHVYWQRPTPREFLFLYANVGATVFAAQSIEDLDLAEVVEPIVPSVVEAAGLGATVVLAPVATVVADAVFQGTVNALLTLRVGCIARRYCRGLPWPDARAVRRSASGEAALLLPRAIAEPAQKLTAEMARKVASSVAGAAKSAMGKVAASVRRASPFGGVRDVPPQGPGGPPSQEAGGQGA
jgi:uncharacterized membrane protein YcjF (UPF0283 family)